MSARRIQSGGFAAGVMLQGKQIRQLILGEKRVAAVFAAVYLASAFFFPSVYAKPRIGQRSEPNPYGPWPARIAGAIAEIVASFRAGPPVASSAPVSAYSPLLKNIGV